MAASPSAAFFDLDRTLMEGSSAFQFGRAAYKAGLMSRRRLIADAVANLRFRLRGASDDDTNQLRDRISKSLAGVRVRDLERLGASVLGGVLPRIYPEVLAIAHRHQDEGRRVYIVTAAAGELAEMLARVLALDGGIGSQFSSVLNGVYTGRPEGLFIYGAGKATAIEQLAREQNLDLAASYAYSDSVSDLPMLRTVGHPVVVNPDRELLSLARAEGWEVLRLDHLSRRLKGAALLAAAAAAGGAGTAALAARTRGRGTAERTRLRARRTIERVPPRSSHRRRLSVRG
ncbi:MAG TPA: HAD-IB family hydrolase [Solirubrobacteraceae bacterium]|jgi:HAD superfamily hydrolase (TIGR01490 family)|nr:HAD-IB family hydrolase [Solirubrobacteraceae bacterium]